MRALTTDPFALRLFTDAQEGIAVYDASGALVAWNAAARAITGWDQEVARTKDLLAKGAGMIEIRDGKWVDLRPAAVAAPAGDLRMLLFNDATTQVALREAKRHLTEGGLIDDVTTLAGPRIAIGHLERSIALARRDSRAVGVIAVGVEVPRVAEDVPIDELMEQVGKRMVASTRASDLASRWNRAELLVVLTAMSHPPDAAIVAVRLLLHLSRPYVLQGRERSATFSLGVASFPTDGDSADAVLGSAREVMEQVRADGGGYRVR